MPCCTTEYLFPTKFSQRVSWLTELSLYMSKSAEVQPYGLFTLHGVETKDYTVNGAGRIANNGY